MLCPTENNMIASHDAACTKNPHNTYINQPPPKKNRKKSLYITIMSENFTCSWGDLNPHSLKPHNFKSRASTIPPQPLLPPVGLEPTQLHYECNVLTS